jgi:hypothetical protein
MWPHLRVVFQRVGLVDPCDGAAVEIEVATEARIGLVDAGEGIAVIPSFGLVACRGRMVIASELVSPTMHLDFRQICNPGTKLPAEAAEFRIFLKRHLAGWTGDASRASVKLR